MSNGNFLSQKEQIKLVGAELPGGVGGGVDLVASSSVDPLSFLDELGGELFIVCEFVLVLVHVYSDLLFSDFLFFSKNNPKKKKKQAFQKSIQVN